MGDLLEAMKYAPKPKSIIRNNEIKNTTQVGKPTNSLLNRTKNYISKKDKT